MPDHPYADCKGFIYEHRFVMEQVIGRYLTPKEVVHHKNEIPTDNSPENLVLCKNQTEHIKIHKGEV